MKASLDEIFQWDVKTWSQALPFWEKNVEIKAGLKVLTIGERGGGLALLFAEKGCAVTCTDFNDFPLTTKDLHQKYRVDDQIKYELGVDVCDLSRYSDETFDIVAFKSVLGALSKKEKQQIAFDEMYRVLKPNGTLLFAENLKGSRLHRFLRAKFVKWENYWRYFDLKKDADFYQKYKSKRFKVIGFLATFGRSENQRKVLARFDKLVIRLVPKSWRYVLIGVLRK